MVDRVARVGDGGTFLEVRDLDLRGRVTYWKSLFIHARRELTEEGQGRLSRCFGVYSDFGDLQGINNFWH